MTDATDVVKEIEWQYSYLRNSHIDWHKSNNTLKALDALRDIALRLAEELNLLMTQHASLERLHGKFAEENARLKAEVEDE